MIDIPLTKTEETKGFSVLKIPIFHTTKHCPYCGSEKFEDSVHNKNELYCRKCSGFFNIDVVLVVRWINKEHLKKICLGNNPIEKLFKLIK